LKRFSKGEKLVKDIKPIWEENYFNLERDQKYQMIFKKSLEIIEWFVENKCDDIVSAYFLG
jgi:hypothetical protein